MKKILIVLVALLILIPTTALASEGDTALPENDETATPAPQETSEESIAIAPDSVFYPLKLMIESISITLTTDENNKAQLLVKYANRRLLESEIMSAEANEALAQELLEESLKLLGEANAILTEAAPESEPGEVLQDLAEIGEEVAIAIELTLDGDENLEKLLEKAEEEVVKSIATQVFLTSKDNFFDAKDAFTDAREAYQEAKKSGDEDAILAAFEAFEAAEQYKDELEAVKDGFEELKDSIEDEYEDEDDDDRDDDDDDKDDEDDDDDEDDNDDNDNDDDDDEDEDDDDDDDDAPKNENRGKSEDKRNDNH